MLRAFRRGMPSAQVERIILQIADALTYLHGRDPPIVHRDIKPQNMLVVGNTIKLGDVGTARALEGGGRDTSRGLGSLAYTAPERFDRKIFPASDVYSLGISAYELLTNEWVYTGENILGITEAQFVKDHLMSALDLKMDLPEKWRHLLGHCLAKEPNDRWSASEVVEFLSADTPKRTIAPKKEPEPKPIPKTMPVRSPDLTPQPRQDLTPQPPSRHGKGEPDLPLSTGSPLPASGRGARGVRFVLLGIGVVLAAAIGIGAWQLGGGREESSGGNDGADDDRLDNETSGEVATKAPPGCGPTEHLSGTHCCPRGEEWVEARDRCLCLDKALCGSGSRPLFEVKAPGEWLVIRAGSFMMGSPEGEVGRYDNEQQHRVTLTRDFLIQTTEVTQQQWRQLMKNNPSTFTGCGAECPVESVNWFDALAYSNALSRLEGLEECYDLSDCTGQPGQGYECQTSKIRWRRGLDCEGYRLPTEAEWEYAARAGTKEATYNGNLDRRHLECQRGNKVLDAIGWFCGNHEVSYSGAADCSGWGSRHCGTHPVGEKQSNPWGLYDMFGNVWEWSWDRYAVYPSGDVTDPVQRRAGSDRVVRGGSWYFLARYTRAAARNRHAPGNRSLDLGVRVVRSLP
jgi:formylglycine-generating enzyme required for sulfatase activity